MGFINNPVLKNNLCKCHTFFSICVNQWIFLPNPSIKLKQLYFLRIFSNGLIFPILQKKKVVSQSVIAWYYNATSIASAPQILVYCTYISITVSVIL